MQDSLSDQQLIVQFARQRDPRAFERLMQRWDRRILAFLAKASGDLEVAKDLRQEVFFRLYRYGGSYNPNGSFPTWLFRIAVNVLRTWQSHQGRHLAVEVPADEAGEAREVADPAPGPRARAGEAEFERQARAAIGRLALEERQLLLLRLEQELSYREIGAILDAPETTIKSRFYAILARLQKALPDWRISEGAVSDE